MNSRTYFLRDSLAAVSRARRQRIPQNAGRGKSRADHQGGAEIVGTVMTRVMRIPWIDFFDFQNVRLRILIYQYNGKEYHLSQR